MDLEHGSYGMRGSYYKKLYVEDKKMCKITQTIVKIDKGSVCIHKIISFLYLLQFLL